MSKVSLQALGLSSQEGDLYTLLLKLGESPVVKIVQNLKLKRTTVYALLSSLEKKGLVTKKDFQKKIHFKPVSPSKLLDLAEEKSKEFDEAKASLRSFVPYLSSLYLNSVDQPIVRTFDGVEGLKEIYNDILDEGKPGYSVLQAEDMDEELEEWVVDVFSKKRAKKKMPLKIIVASGKNAKQIQKRDIEFFRFTRIVSSELFPFKHEVTIYGDKVAFVNYKKGEKPLGMIIKHSHFATTMKAFFDLAWLSSEKVL